MQTPDVAEQHRQIDQLIHESAMALSKSIGFGTGDCLIMLSMRSLDGMIDIAPNSTLGLVNARVSWALAQATGDAPATLVEEWAAEYQAALEAFYAEAKERSLAAAQRN